MDKRIFCAMLGGGWSWVDKDREEHGDWMPVAFLGLRSLEFETRKGWKMLPQSVKDEILADAKSIQDRKGEKYQVSSCDQFVTIGG